eukprot:5495444-Amphidinium_carterae.1
MLCRPGMAISLSAASIHVALDKQSEDAPLSSVFKTATKFKRAVRKLNVGKDGNLKRAVATTAVQDYIECLSSLDASAWQTLVDAVEQAGQTYLGCMAALEHAALFQKPKTFAKKLPQDGKHCLA